MTNDFDRIVELHGLPFKFDRDALGKEKIAAQAKIDEIAQRYAAGFIHVEDMQPAYMVPTTDEASPARQIRVFDNHEIRGDGDTSDEAISDFECNLATRPLTGARLHWRCRPETDYFLNFPRRKVLWRVYARFSVLP